MSKKQFELEECKQQAREIMAKVAPHFDRAHSFSMLIVLSDLVAQWIRSHPPQDVNRLGQMLVETVGERLDDLAKQDEQETLH
jgi:hypothetical protein